MTPKFDFDSLFAGLFGPAQSAKAKEEELRRLEEAARWLAEAEGLTLSEYLRSKAEAGNEPASTQNENKSKWIN